MKLKQSLQTLIAAFLLAGLTLSASAQMQGGGGQPGEQPDQVEQLARMVDLSDEQQEEIRAAIEELEPKIEEAQSSAQEVHEELQDLAGPDFDEEKIHKKAKKLGELSGEITALQVILRSTVDKIMTEEQRNKLEEMQKQQQEMQQQMQQRQMQQQMEQQMEQQQQEQGGGQQQQGGGQQQAPQGPPSPPEVEE